MSKALLWVPALCAMLASGQETNRVGAAAPPKAAPDGALVERTIYVPYDKFWKTFEKPGRGVFIPYEEFERLWAAARSNAPARPEGQAPVGALVREASGTIQIGPEVADATATLQVELLKEGWHVVPLGLRDVGVTRAEAGGVPARIRFDEASGYQLVLERKAGAPAELAVQLRFARAYEKTPGLNRLTFAPPDCAVSRWQIVIPEPGVKARVLPQIAATVEPSGTNETRVGAVVGPVRQLTVEWTPKSEGAVGLEALASVQARQEVSIAEGLVRIRADLLYGIHRAKLQTLELEVPADFKVVAVEDQNVREWRLTEEAGRQRIRIDLFEPAASAQALVVELEKFGETNRLDVPLVRALNVGRQQGFLAVKTAPALRADVAERRGVIQVAPDAWPAEWKGRDWPLAFQYSGSDVRLALGVERVKPRLEVHTLTLLDVDPARLREEFRARFRVERAGVFKLQVRLPPDFTLERVEGLGQGAIKPVTVESHYTDDQGLLTVNLSTPATGEAGLRLELVRRLDLADLREPTGKQVDLPVTVPCVAAEGLESQRGFVLARINPALRANLEDARGLAWAFPDEAQKWIAELGGEMRGGYLSQGHDPGSLVVRAQRRQPYVSAAQLLQADVESGRVRYRATFRYDIQFTGVKKLLLDLPAALAGQVALPPEQSSLRIRPAAGAELEGLAATGGVARLVVEGPSEFFGASAVVLMWSAKMDDLAPGKSADIAVPVISPAGVDHAWGQVVVKKAESIDVVPADLHEGLRPVDPQRDLVAGMKVEGAAQAYEFRGPWALTLRATRYEVADVKTTSIERGLVRGVATRGGLASMQALYKLRSARQRLAVTLPAGVEFDTRPARVNGTPVPLEQGTANEYFIPLAGHGPDDPILLELRYTVKEAGRVFVAPEFKGEPAIQKIYHSVYLPNEWRYLGYVGPWSDDNAWILRGLDLRKRARLNAEALLAWVAEGVGGNQAGAESFAVDGQHILFSALRPPGGEAGALRVRTMEDLPWKLATVIAVLVAGFFVVRLSFGRVLTFAAAVLGAWALAMVFVPEWASSLLSRASFGALAAVAAVWFVRQLLSGGFWRGWTRRPAASPPAPSVPAPTAPAAPAGPPTVPPSESGGKAEERHED